MRWAGAVLLLCVLAIPAHVCAQSTPGGGDPEAVPGDESTETAEIAGGGLMLVPDDRIAIEAIEVVISRATVRVTYVVRNASTETLGRVVSWVLPDIDAAAIGDDAVVLSQPDAMNFAGGAVAVDGREVALVFEQRAHAFGRDVTGLIEAAGLPLNPKGPRVEAALAQLAPNRLSELEEGGVIRRDDDHFAANWTLRTTGFWRQLFEPGKITTISLAYAPIAATGPWRAADLGALGETYCIDKTAEGAVGARLSASPNGLVAHRLTLSSSVAGGKAVPNFRLAIEKPQVNALAATCRSGLKTVGPTLLEWTAKDVTISDDIRVLFVD